MRESPGQVASSQKVKHGECAEGGLLSFAKDSSSAQELCFHQEQKGPWPQRPEPCNRLHTWDTLITGAWRLPVLPPAEVEEGTLWLRKGWGMKVGKWLGALHSSHLQVAAILAQEWARKHTFPGKCCLSAAATDANLTHLWTGLRDALETAHWAGYAKLGHVYIRLQDAAIRRWPQDKAEVRGYVHIVC